MRILPKLAIAATALLLGPATTGRTLGEGSGDLVGVHWTVSAAGEDAAKPTLGFRYHTSNTSFSLDGRQAADLSAVRSALGAAEAGEVAFTIDREAGVLTCRGNLTRPYVGSGTCSFAANRAFEQNLRAYQLAPDGKTDLLAMALLNADRALIDGLVRQKVAPESADDVLAAAALEVTPDYIAGLRSAGLDLRSIEDAIACRALGVEADYVRGISEAGYKPTAEQIIAMKATGVTPEYARRMNAAAKN